MQIVGYDTAAGDGPAALVIAEEGEIDRYPLQQGEELSFALETRHCAGAVDGETHRSCSQPDAPYCDRHETHWPCARCSGNCAMPVEACHEEHAVYLAGFAPDTVKVGVTRTWRLETRLREQGADRGAHIRTVKNGRIARQLEADLAERFPDRVRVPEKIASLPESLDVDRWQAVLEEFDPIEVCEFNDDLSLSRRPVPETIASGTVRGTKGRVLVLELSETVYAVDLRDLVGFDVTEASSTRSLQSSFGTFA